MPDARAQWELKRTIVQQKLDEVLPRAMRAHRIDMWIVEDTATALVSFESGGMGVIESTTAGGESRYFFSSALSSLVGTFD